MTAGLQSETIRSESEDLVGAHLTPTRHTHRALYSPAAPRPLLVCSPCLHVPRHIQTCDVVFVVAASLLANWNGGASPSVSATSKCPNRCNCLSVQRGVW